MPSLLGNTLSRRIHHLLTWAVLLATCCVLPRALVVCSGPHCESRIEFVHAFGACCDHQQGERGDDSEHPTKNGRSGCTDVPIAIDEGPLPERAKLALVDSPALTEIERLPSIATRDYEQLELPPPTGPPRVDRRTELLATTVLLI